MCARVHVCVMVTAYEPVFVCVCKRACARARVCVCVCIRAYVHTMR